MFFFLSKELPIIVV